MLTGAEKPLRGGIAFHRASWMPEGALGFSPGEQDQPVTKRESFTRVASTRG